MEEDDIEFELDPNCCLMCDKKHKTLEKCMVHMHKFHGFFIPDIEYLMDPKGFLTYVGLKVKRDFICLYCNELCHPFSSLEAVRKHMEAKSHCKVHYGDGGDEEDAELEEFYDYSSIYANEGENQMVVSGEPANTVELFGGSELVITKRGENKVTSRTLGSREFIHALLQTEATTIFSEAHRQLSSLEVQKHGSSNSAVQGGHSEDEGDERDEQKRSENAC
ncbi:hypothetical protein YC2023_103308 [Brassica napus]